MRRATRIVASALGTFAGFGGPEHGVFEILRGHHRPNSLFISAIGPPCDPEQAWHLCEPALTVIPSYLVTGIVATVVGLVTMVWSMGWIHRRWGGPVLIVLCAALLLTGGGLVPPIIGMMAGVMATRINVPVAHRTGLESRFLARLWPWPLVAFFVWVFGQFVVGFISNDAVKAAGFFSPLMLITLLVLSLVCARARDIDAVRSRQTGSS